MLINKVATLKTGPLLRGLVVFSHPALVVVYVRWTACCSLLEEVSALEKAFGIIGQHARPGA